MHASPSVETTTPPPPSPPNTADNEVAIDLHPSETKPIEPKSIAEPPQTSSPSPPPPIKQENTPAAVPSVAGGDNNVEVENTQISAETTQTFFAKQSSEGPKQTFSPLPEKSQEFTAGAAATQTLEGSIEEEESKNDVYDSNVLLQAVTKLLAEWDKQKYRTEQTAAMQSSQKSEATKPTESATTMMTPTSTTESSTTANGGSSIEGQHSHDYVFVVPGPIDPSAGGTKPPQTTPPTQQQQSTANEIATANHYLTKIGNFISSYPPQFSPASTPSQPATNQPQSTKPVQFPASQYPTTASLPTHFSSVGPQQYQFPVGVSAPSHFSYPPEFIASFAPPSPSDVPNSAAPTAPHHAVTTAPHLPSSNPPPYTPPPAASPTPSRPTTKRKFQHLNSEENAIINAQGFECNSNLKPIVVIMQPEMDHISNMFPRYAANYVNQQIPAAYIRPPSSELPKAPTTTPSKPPKPVEHGTNEPKTPPPKVAILSSPSPSPTQLVASIPAIPPPTHQCERMREHSVNIENCDDDFEEAEYYDDSFYPSAPYFNRQPHQCPAVPAAPYCPYHNFGMNPYYSVYNLPPTGYQPQYYQQPPPSINRPIIVKIDNKESAAAAAAPPCSVNSEKQCECSSQPPPAQAHDCSPASSAANPNGIVSVMAAVDKGSIKTLACGEPQVSSYPTAISSYHSSPPDDWHPYFANFISSNDWMYQPQFQQYPQQPPPTAPQQPKEQPPQQPSSQQSK